jgi:ribose/xylose/arabinose/galactoside ABC-type transport system permease subunit
MLIQDIFSVPVFLLLLFAVYVVMWLYLKRKSLNKNKQKE